MNERSDSGGPGDVGRPERAERKRQRRERGQRDILDAAERALVARGGLAKLTMEDIAAEAGYTPGALYGYFRSKAVIERELFERLERELAAALDEPEPGGLPFLERLSWRLGGLTRVAERHVGLFYAFFVQGADAHDETGRLPRLHEQFITSLSRLIEQGIREGVIWDTDPRDLTLALMGIHREFLIRWLYSDRSVPLEARSRRAVAVFLRGAGAGTHEGER